MERFSKANQTEDLKTKLLNSGIQKDDRILVDTHRVMGSFSATYKEDIELQRRLLSNEFNTSENEKALE